MILSWDFLDVIILWEELGQRISLDDVWENLYCPPLYCTIHRDGDHDDNDDSRIGYLTLSKSERHWGHCFGQYSQYLQFSVLEL